MNRYLRIILGFFFLSPGGIILLTDSLPKTFRNPHIGFKMEGKRVNNARETTIRMKRYRSTTTADPDATADHNDKRAKEEFVRVKRRKVAMMFAYSGVGYFGLQRNKGTKTIEGDIMTALLKAGLIDEDIFNTPQMIKFQRAARTDKGVSALKQIVSLKLPEAANKDDINAHLPEQIRIFSIKRVTKGFNSKNAASARTYSYTCPSYAFAPPDETNEDYRLSPERLQFIQSLLKQYEGTHNFHNFTSKRKPKDPSCWRFIMSFQCEEPFIKSGVEFITVKVKGQSFMLHQIRKMVALAMSVSKGYIPVEFIRQMYEFEQYDLPLAPGHGLLLEQVHYDIYNDRYGGDGMHDTLHFNEVDDEVDKFRHLYILPHMVQSDTCEKLMLIWLQDKLHGHGFETRAQKLEAIARGEIPATSLAEDNEEDDDDDDEDRGKQRGRHFKKNGCERNELKKTEPNVTVCENVPDSNGSNVQSQMNTEVEVKSSMTKETVLDVIADEKKETADKSNSKLEELVKHTESI